MPFSGRPSSPLIDIPFVETHSGRGIHLHGPQLEGYLWLRSSAGQHVHPHGTGLGIRHFVLWAGRVHDLRCLAVSGLTL